MTAVRLRPMTVAEYEQWEAMQLRAVAADLEAHEELPDGSMLAGARQDYGHVAPAGRETEGQEFCAVEDAASGAVVGMLWLGETWPFGMRTLHVFSLDVAEAHRNRGYGTAVLARVEEIARERGIDRLELAAHSDNAGALRLYERAGYRPGYVLLSRRLGGAGGA